MLLMREDEEPGDVSSSKITSRECRIFRLAYQTISDKPWKSDSNQEIRHS